MTQQGEADVEASVDIAADAGAVYELITDLPTMAQVAAETTSMEWVKGNAANVEHIAHTLQRLKQKAEAS